MGHYLAVLATECKLLLNTYNNAANWDEQQIALAGLEATKSEIYYALQALKRLDHKAEEYLSQGINPLSTDDINGLLLRDDVDQFFHLNFENDYSQVFERECDFIRTHSNFSPVEMWSTDGNGNPTIPGTQYAYDAMNVMSLDQVTSILMGLKTVYTLVPDYVVQPTSGDEPMHLREEARNIALRIIDYIMTDVEGCGDNCRSFNIRNWDGLFRPAGYDLTFVAPFIVKIGLELGHQELIQLQANDELQNLNVAIQLHPQKFLETMMSIPNLFGEGDLSCQDNIEDLCSDLISSGEPVTIGTVQLGELFGIIDQAQDQWINLGVNGDICFTLNSEVRALFNSFNFDIEGVSCDNAISLLMDVFIVVWVINNPIFSIAAKVVWNEVADNTQICNSDLEDLFGMDLSEMMNDDNVHILCELATVANKWSPEYIDYVAGSSEMDWYPLLHAVLHNDQAPYSFLASEDIRTEYLDSAPCAGPWDDPNQGNIDPNLPWSPDNYDPAPGTTPGWVGANRLFHPGNAYDGIESPDFRGEYSGLDYMLYHNLYSLLWPNLAPQFKRHLSCNCITEISSADELITNLEVNRKF